VGLGHPTAAWRRNRFGIAFMAALLMMFLYGWLRVATMLFALFFGLELPPLGNFLQTAFFTPEHRDFALLGTGVGAVLASIVFGLSAFSLPMLVDRPVDPVTAAATSMRACLANPLLALCWAATIVGLTWRRRRRCSWASSCAAGAGPRHLARLSRRGGGLSPCWPTACTA
jgi:hypothetical protein